jgi:diketogulonate reductase-like aldo/keto reductase
MEPSSPSRRRVLQGVAGLAATALGPGPLRAAAQKPLLKPIPASGETIPAIGMGTWITFNVAPYTDARAQRVVVLRTFFEGGGRLVDSSPMYGLAEAAVGHCREKLAGAPQMFAATKVWTPTRIAGVGQMNLSLKLWGLAQFDLMQVHNLLDWQAHLPTLKEWQAQKRLRYLGVTTSHGRRHDEMLEIIEQQRDFDFVQFSYSIGDREAEARLLPAAAARGKAVITNRPFRTGDLFERVAGKPLPEWAGEIGCSAWSQFFLKFVISHPAVTCAIPATSSIEHMRENMAALHGPMPDAAMRQRMAAYFDRVAA